MKLFRKKLVRLAAGACFLACLLCGMVYLKHVADYRRAVRETVIEEIDLSQVSDGTYGGEYDAGLVSARVEVTVVGGAITGIRILEHKNDRGGPAAGTVTGEGRFYGGVRKESRGRKPAALLMNGMCGLRNAAYGCRRGVERTQMRPWATMTWETFRKPAMLAPTTRSPGTPHSSEAL